MKINKNTRINIYITSVLLSLFLLFINLLLVQKPNGLNNKSAGITNVYADHDEDEDEEDEEDEEDREDEDEDDEDRDEEDEYEYQEVIYEGESIPANVITIGEQILLQPVIRYITVVDPGFDIDTDKDGLVDAIDPHPTIDEKLLFTDDDNDGVPNATDAYPGDNDFLYLEFEDQNNNGVLDSFE